MPEIPEIPEIRIPLVEVPDLSPKPGFPKIEMPGCTYQHRDQNLQPQLLVTDPGGVSYSCDATIPSFYPMDWNAKDIKVIENKQNSSKKQETPQSDRPDPKIPQFECPGPDNLRVGDILNAESREKVVSHKIVEGNCIEVYAPTTFVDKYIPTASTAATTFGITIVATTAATLAPSLLNKVLKPAFKQLITRVQKLFGKKPRELSVSERRKKQRELRK